MRWCGQGKAADPNTGGEAVKGLKNDSRLFVHCCWRWKWTIVILLFIPYWIGALVWDHVSAQNHEENPAEQHYSSDFITGIAVFIAVYVSYHYYSKLLCDNMDEKGCDRDSGCVRRPDIWVIHKVTSMPERSQMILGGIAMLLWLVWIMIECGDEAERWQCFAGLAFFIMLSWALSYKPRYVKWRPVFWGLFLQWLFGFIVLRTSWGYDAFEFISEQITIFLGYTTVGAGFVFAGEYTSAGDRFLPTAFAFGILPTVVFFSSIVYLLYWMGVLQKVISSIAFFMQVTLGTSASESLSAAGNIFVGQTEAPLLVRPFLAEMTESEIHAIMTGGFATIAGGVLAVYIEMGVSAHHLISASVMSAPAALAISKIFYPETEESKTANGKAIEISGLNQAMGPIDALYKGAAISISLCANIAAMLITFPAVIEMLDAWIGYFGERVGLVGSDELSFTKICGWILYPLAWLMGVPPSDCQKLGELMGYKVFVNEFIAYLNLNIAYCNEEMSARGVLVATYALCGFSNLGSMGIQLGGLGPLAPEKKPVMTKVVFRAMIAGNVACFMTACVAGILTRDATAEFECS